MKEQTVARFKEWAKTHGEHEHFSSGNRSWTKSEFEAEFLGKKQPKVTKPINIDVKVKENADVEPTLETGHTEESGE